MAAAAAPIVNDAHDDGADDYVYFLKDDGPMVDANKCPLDAKQLEAQLIAAGRITVAAPGTWTVRATADESDMLGAFLSDVMPAYYADCAAKSKQPVTGCAVGCVLDKSDGPENLYRGVEVILCEFPGRTSAADFDLLTAAVGAQAWATSIHPLPLRVQRPLAHDATRVPIELVDDGKRAALQALRDECAKSMTPPAPAAAIAPTLCLDQPSAKAMLAAAGKTLFQAGHLFVKKIRSKLVP